MKHYRVVCLMCVLALLFGSCREAEPVRIKIVCTSDVHGNFFPYDFLTDKPAQGSLARVSSYLSALRSSDAFGENVIYVDNGDILHGQPTSYYYNTVALSQCHLAAEALNYLGCEVAVLGNHDIETGGPTYQRYINDLECGVVGGNIYFEDTEHPFLPPYIIVEREGVKVAFMGLTTPALTDWLPRNLWTGLEFKDMETAAKRWMDYLHQHEKPELVIGVFHSGYDGGIVTEEYAENAAKSVAINVPGFDAIFFGHIHQPHVASVVNVEGDTVLLVNPANNACKVAALDVAVNRSGEPRVTLAAELVDMDAYEPDTAYMRHFVPHMERVRKYVAKKIGESTHEVYSRDAYFGPSDYVDFVHRMQLDITKAQVSLAAPLAYDSSLSGGDLHVRDMFEFYRYENMLYVMHLKGQEIKDYLEMSYGQWTNQMKRADDHLLLFDEETLTSATPRLKNLYYNFDSAAGIIYEVDVTKPVGERIRIKSMADGKPFSLEAMYRVAVNSYRGNGGGELLTKGAGIPREELEERVISSTDIDLRFYMLNYIEMRQNIDPQRLNHWKFVPEHWANVAAKRDYKLLFGR